MPVETTLPVFRLPSTPSSNMHTDRIKMLEDLEQDLRGLPEFNHYEMQAAQSLSLARQCLLDAQAHRHPKKETNTTEE